MAEPADAAVLLQDFPGLIDAQDPDDIPTGAATLQTNATSHIAGELNCRRGWREVTFES